MKYWISKIAQIKLKDKLIYVLFNFDNNEYQARQDVFILFKFIIKIMEFIMTELRKNQFWKCHS